MRSHYDTVCAALVASVVTLTYQRPTALQAAATAADDTAAASATTAAAVRAPVSYHPRIAALLAERQDVALFAAGPEGADAGAEQEGDAEARAVVASLAQLDAIDALRRRVVAEAEGQVRLPHLRACVAARCAVLQRAMAVGACLERRVAAGAPALGAHADGGAGAWRG